MTKTHYRSRPDFNFTGRWDDVNLEIWASLLRNTVAWCGIKEAGLLSSCTSAALRVTRLSEWTTCPSIHLHNQALALPVVIPSLQTDWHTDSWTDLSVGQTDRCCITTVTAVAASYLLFAPDDDVPRLPVFLQGGGGVVRGGYRLMNVI